MPPGVSLQSIMSGQAAPPAAQSQTPQVPIPNSITSPLDTGSADAFGVPAQDSGTGDPVLDQMMGMQPVVSLYPTKKPEANKLPKPDLGVVKANVDGDYQLYAETLWRMANDVSMYRQHTSGKPLGFLPSRERAVHMANLSNLVNKLSNMFSGTKVLAKAPYNTTAEEKSAQRVEDAYYYLRKKMKQEYAKQSGGNLQRDEYFYLNLHGRLCYRILPDLSDPEFPYNIALMDPATCFPTFSNGKGGLIRMVRKYKATVGSIVTAYADIDPKLQQKLAAKLGYDTYDDYTRYMNQEGDVVEYYDRWWRYVEFMGLPVLELTAHEYGFVPFTYVMAVGEPQGMLTPAGGYYADWKDPENYVFGPYIRNMQSDYVEKGVSVFHYLRNTHRLREALNTILYNEIEKMGNPPTITYAAPHLVGKDNPPLDVKRGGNNQRTLGMQEVQSIPTSPRPTDFSPLQTNLDMAWAEGALPPGAFGGTPGANVSGIAIDTLLTAAKDLTLPYVEAWQNAQSQLFELAMLHYRDRISPVFAMTYPSMKSGGNELAQLTVQDLAACGMYLDMKVTGLEDANEGARIAAVNQAIQAGIYSQRYGMERMEIENPDKMFQDILVEKAMQQQEVMQNVMIPSALASSGNMDLLDIWLSVVVAPSIPAMAQAGGGAGGGGAPGSPPPSPLLPPGTGGNGGSEQQMGGAQ